MSRQERPIPSLDGLRAIAVSLVIVAHLNAMPDIVALSRGWSDQLAPLGLLGVRLFFVISGFLITKLLADELARTGTIRLGHFYFRRTLRIFPAYYVMLAIAAMLGHLGVLDTAGAHWGWLVSYTSNLGPTQPNDVGHSWSLGVEEQFYLLWPAVLLAAGSRRGFKIALGAIAAMPLARLAWFAVFHTGRLVFATPFDFLAAGCALALATPQLALDTRWRRLMAAPWPALILPLVALYHWQFAMSYRWRFMFDTMIGQPACAILIAVAIAWYVANPDGRVGKLLNSRVAQAIGVTSYSIYLYQEFWLRPGSYPWYAALVGIGVTTYASYRLVEKPGLRLRRWIEERAAQRREQKRAAHASPENAFLISRASKSSL